MGVLCELFLTDCRWIVVDQLKTMRSRHHFHHLSHHHQCWVTQFIHSRCLLSPVLCFNLAIFFLKKSTPCKVNKQLSDKGMKFVQTTSDGGKVRQWKRVLGRVVWNGSCSLCLKNRRFRKRLRIFPFAGLLWSGRRWCRLLRGLAGNLHFFLVDFWKKLCFENQRWEWMRIMYIIT